MKTEEQPENLTNKTMNAISTKGGFIVTNLRKLQPQEHRHNLPSFIAVGELEGGDEILYQEDGRCANYQATKFFIDPIHIAKLFEPTEVVHSEAQKITDPTLLKIVSEVYTEMGVGFTIEKQNEVAMRYASIRERAKEEEIKSLTEDLEYQAQASHINADKILKQLEEIRLMEITLSHKTTLLESCEKALSQRDEEIEILKSVIEDRFSVQSNIQGYISGVLNESKSLKEEIAKLKEQLAENKNEFPFVFNVSEGELKAKEERDANNWFIGLPQRKDGIYEFTREEIVKLLTDFSGSEVSTQKEWISVKDRLPEIKKKVIFLTDHIEFPDNSFTGLYYGEGKWGKSESYFVVKNVTHWMPLPDVSNLNK